MILKIVWSFCLLLWSYWCLMWKPAFFGDSSFPLANMIFWGSIILGVLCFGSTIYPVWFK